MDDLPYIVTYVMIVFELIMIAAGGFLVINNLIKKEVNDGERNNNKK